MAFDKRFPIGVLIAVVAILGAAIVGLRFVGWSFGKLSPAFRDAARSSLTRIEACEGPDIESDFYRACIAEAKTSLAITKKLMKGGNEHRAYYTLETYLEHLENCRKQHNTRGEEEAAQCKQMVDRRVDLSNWLKK